MSTAEIPNPLGLDLSPLELAAAPIEIERGVWFRADKSAFVKTCAIALGLSLASLGLYLPWAWAKLAKAAVEGLEIGGRRPKFRGRPLPLFGATLAAILISVLTLGLAAPYALVLLFRHVVAQTEIDELRCEFKGRAGELALIGVSTAGLSLMTFGLYVFWGMMRTMAWAFSGVHISGRRLTFFAPGGAWLKFSIKVSLKVIFTLGLYTPWALFESLVWITERADVQGAAEETWRGQVSPTRALASVVGGALMITGIGYGLSVVQPEAVTALGQRAFKALKSALPEAPKPRYIHVWEDKKGQLHMTDAPPPKGARLIRKERKR